MEPELWQLLGDGAADDEVAAIIRLGQQSVFPAGVRVLTQFGDICTIRLRRIDIPRLNGAAEVAVMEAGDTYFAPDLELNLETISETLPLTPQNTDERRPADQTATGRNVVIGVVDWGFDFCHPDFRNKDGSTRILALWDQRNTQKPGAPQPFGYGTLHEREAIDTALRQTDPFKALDYHPADADTGIGCHATHVASIAAGSGGGARPTGIAPEADLVFVQNAPWGENTSEKLGDSVTLLEAIDFIFRIAGDRPCVVNLSMGRHGEQHDGSTLIEQGLDAALRAAPGRAICMSNGNYLDKHIHAAGQLRPTEHHDLVLEVNEKGTTYNEVEIWYSWRDKITAELRGPDDALVARMDVGERITLHSGGVEVGKAYHRAQEPNNLDNHIDIYLYKTAQPGRWTLRLIALDVVDGRFHAWIERDGLCPKCQARFRPEDAVPTCTTGTICNGLRTIAVGAYDNHDENRRIAHFSSAGPTRDGRLKPDLCAPGVSVLAARSAPREPTGDVPLLTRMSGTSMAAPHTTGCVALMFEVAPRRLRIEETHNLLLQSAERVRVQDEVPDRIGIGFLDIDAAVKAARELPDRGITPQPKSHIPPPPASSRSTLQPRAVGRSERVDQPVERMPAFAASEWEAPVERTPRFGARGTDSANAEVLDRIYPEVTPDLAEGDPYPCAGVLSAAGQARRAEDIRRHRNPRPQVLAGRPLCPGESHIVHSGPDSATIDLLIWNFDIDGSYLKTQHEAALDQLIAAMHKALRGTSSTARSFSVQLSGFASRTGDTAYNAALATEREEAVQAYLTANWEKFAGGNESPIAPMISFARNPGGFDPAAPPGRESAQARSARIIAVPAGAPVPPPRPFPKSCGTLTVWINAFIPRDVPGYTFRVPAGPHKGKTAIPCPTIALPANWHCRSRGYLTDQRDFSDSPTASVRMRSVAEIGLIAPGLIRHPGAEHVTSGTTEIDKTTGAVTCAESADMSRCSFGNVGVRSDPVTGNYTITLRVKGAASDPCVNLAADIDYDGEIAVLCSPRGNLVEVTFNGRIDAFPAFEMYAHLDGVTRTLFRSPPPAGNTVVDLLGGANRPIGGRARFEGCHLGDEGAPAQEAGDAAELDPVSLILGLGIASQLGRPVPNQQAQPAAAKPDAPPPGEETVGSGREAAGQAADAESLSEAWSEPGPEPAVPAAPTGVERAAEALAALSRTSRPAAVFDAVTARRDRRLLERLQGAWLLLAGPGEPLPAGLEPGDVIMRRAMGEPDLGHAFAVVDATLLTVDQLPGLGLRGEGQGGGWLVHVAEDRPGFSATSGICRAVLDARQRVPYDQLILRPMIAGRVEVESAAEGGGDVPCASDISAFGMAWRQTDLNNRRNPRPQIVDARPFCPGQADPPQRGGAAGQTIKLLLWNFDVDGSYPKKQHETALGQLVAELHGNIRASNTTDPAQFSYTLYLSGFASQTGNAAHNMALAADRERAVERWLREHIEDATRIPEVSIGPQVSFVAKAAGFDPAYPPKVETAKARSVLIEAVPTGSPRPPPHRFEQLQPTRWLPLIKNCISPAGSVTQGNAVLGLIDGADTLRQMAMDIRRTAQRGHFVYLTGWSVVDNFPLIPGDGTSTLLQLLDEAQKRGVQVRVLPWLDRLSAAERARLDSLVNAIGSAISGLLGPALAPLVENIVDRQFPNRNTAVVERINGLRKGSAADVEARLDDSILLFGSQHQKILVVYGPDGLVGYCGGVDINDDRVVVTRKNSGEPLHDVHSRITGPASWDLLQTFLTRWDHNNGVMDPRLIGRAIQRPPPLSPDTTAAKTVQGTCSVAIARTFTPVKLGPWRRERDIKALFECVIRNAVRHIYFEDQYVVHPDAADLLNAAVPRLRSLIVVMPASEISDMPCIWMWRKQFIDRLRRGLSAADRDKIVIATLFRPDMFHTYVHAKSWFVDDELAVIGSANLDYRGWEHDAEANAFIFDDTTPGDGQLTFAQKMRSLLWAEHLTVPPSAVEDAAAGSALWRTPPAGARIRIYDPTAGSDRWSGACNTIRQFVDPRAP